MALLVAQLQIRKYSEDSAKLLIPLGRIDYNLAIKDKTRDTLTGDLKSDFKQ